MCQNSIEVELDKRGGKNFGPPGGKKMTIFMDDLSMPEVRIKAVRKTLRMVHIAYTLYTSFGSPVKPKLMFTRRYMFF